MITLLCATVSIAGIHLLHFVHQWREPIVDVNNFNQALSHLLVNDRLGRCATRNRYRVTWMRYSIDRMKEGCPVSPPSS